MNFDQAFEKLIGHEGGLVDHPADQFRLALSVAAASVADCPR